MTSHQFLKNSEKYLIKPYKIIKELKNAEGNSILDPCAILKAIENLKMSMGGNAKIKIWNVNPPTINTNLIGGGPNTRRRI